MNVEDLKAKQQQIENRYNELQAECSRLQGEWRAYGEMISKTESEDAASTIVVEEKGKDGK